MRADFRDRYGPWAVVAGASEGLGAAYARALAAAGLSVVLVARRADALLEVKASLPATVSARTLVVDLADPSAATAVVDGVADLEVGCVVYNAALSPLGRFVDQPPEVLLRALEVNVRTPTVLLRALVPPMVARGRGAAVLLSSLTAFQGSPFVATYGATKSYALSLAEGLWFELKGTGVDVLAVCAGATTTPSFNRARPGGAPGMLSPEQVAAQTLAALGRGPLLIPGAFNRLASFLMRRLLPRTSTIAIMGDQTRRLGS